MTQQPTWAKNQPPTVAETTARFRLVSLDKLHAAMLARQYMSGYQLAEASGIGVSTINHLVHGRRKTASARTVRGLREALGANVDQIFVLKKSQVHADRTRTAA